MAKSQQRGDLGESRAEERPVEHEVGGCACARLGAGEWSYGRKGNGWIKSQRPDGLNCAKQR